MLTEIGAQFLVMLYVYFLFRYIKTRNFSFLAFSVPLGMLMGLWKYSLITYGFFSLFLLLLHKPFKAYYYAFILIAIGILSVWMVFNHTVTGVWGLSDSNGVQLYNQIVWAGKTLPSEKNPAMQKLRTYIPQDVNLNRGYWDLQDYILPKVNKNWATMSKILGNVAYAAVWEHPVSYFKTTIYLFFKTHGPGKPYWGNLGSLGNIDPEYPLFCGILSKFEFCKPIVNIPHVTILIWNNFINWSNIFYDTLFPIVSMFIFLPSLVYSLLWGDKFMKLFGALHLVGTIPVSMYVQLDPRYLIPFYPFIVLCTMLTIRKINNDLNHYDHTAER